jgi:hypothetical protein
VSGNVKSALTITQNNAIEVYLIAFPMHSPVNIKNKIQVE